MTQLRPDIPQPLPQRMRGLPVDPRGYPVPWFVGQIDGHYDFRVIKPGGFQAAIRRDVCWICGQKLGTHKVFTLGPMCIVNRVNSEPPSHLECAKYAAQACPFLTHPLAKYRNNDDLKEIAKEPAGTFLDRNPGVVALYVTKGFHLIEAGNGVLIELDKPDKVMWFARGRIATKQECEESLDSGLAHLMDMAKEEGPTAVKMLNLRVAEARKLLPP